MMAYDLLFKQCLLLSVNTEPEKQTNQNQMNSSSKSLTGKAWMNFNVLIEVSKMITIVIKFRICKHIYWIIHNRATEDNRYSFHCPCEYEEERKNRVFDEWVIGTKQQHFGK